MNWYKLATEIKTMAIGMPYPRNITWFLTERCNLRCKHCFVHNSTHKPRTEMPWEDSIRFLERINGNIDTITLTGGEPTISPAFPYILQRIDNMNGLKKFLIFTNGMNSDRLLETLEQNVPAKANYAIITSLDGSKDVHNSIRGNPRSYQQVINLLSKRKEIDVIMTINRENYAEINKVIDIVTKYSASLIPNFVRSSTDKHLKLDNPNDLTLDEMRTAIRIWYEYARNNMDFADIVTHKTRLDNWLLYESEGCWRYKCAAGFNEAILYSDGSVAICEMKPPLGTLYDYNLNWKEFWQYHKQTELKTCYCGYDCAMVWSQTKTLLGWINLIKTALKLKLEM